MLHDIIFLVLGLALLVVGANYVTDGAVAVAKRFNVSNLIIGLTVVALGSTLPDMVVCVESAFQNRPAIAVGEVIGSNIFDLLLVVGIIIAKTKRATFQNETSKTSLFSLPFFSCSFDLLNTN